jgi:hypothetical protein
MRTACSVQGSALKLFLSRVGFFPWGRNRIIPAMTWLGGSALRHKHTPFELINRTRRGVTRLHQAGTKEGQDDKTQGQNYFSIWFESQLVFVDMMCCYTVNLKDSLSLPLSLPLFHSPFRPCRWCHHPSPSECVSFPPSSASLSLKRWRGVETFQLSGDVDHGIQQS